MVVCNYHLLGMSRITLNSELEKGAIYTFYSKNKKVNRGKFVKETVTSYVIETVEGSTENIVKDGVYFYCKNKPKTALAISEDTYILCDDIEYIDKKVEYMEKVLLYDNIEVLPLYKKVPNEVCEEMLSELVRSGYDKGFLRDLRDMFYNGDILEWWKSKGAFSNEN